MIMKRVNLIIIRTGASAGKLLEITLVGSA